MARAERQGGHYRTRQTTRRQPYRQLRSNSSMGAAIARGMKQVKSADGNGNFEQVNIKLNLFSPRTS